MISEISDFAFSLEKIVRKGLSSAVESLTIEQILSMKEDIYSTFKEYIVEKTQRWGIEVTDIKLQNILLPDEIIDSLQILAIEEKKKKAAQILEQAKIQSHQNEKVFIIHGRDHKNVLLLKNMLMTRFQLKPVILWELPGKGRTIIEKFEQEAKLTNFAFVLVTPDDFIVEKEVVDERYKQARPNVSFELGWFYGRLGRERVCMLHKAGTHIPSDLEGISRIIFNETIEEKVLEIENELVAAGFRRR